MINNWNQFLNEKIEIKTIYHFTENLDSLRSILYNDMLMSGANEDNNSGLGYDNISFTWNPKLWDIEYFGDLESRWSVRISFDYNRMNKKWKFKPFNYGIDEEMEEIVETEEMEGITEFITEILICSKEISIPEMKLLKEEYPKLKMKRYTSKTYCNQLKNNNEKMKNLSNWKEFNENVDKKIMTKKDRNKVIKEIKIRINKDIKDFDNLLPGKKEQIQDKYIDIVCKENGFTLNDFYAADGKEINKLLKW
jgi:hypothetical protein